MDDTPLVEVAVWDAAVRIVHWLMVVVLVVLLATGLAGNDWLVWHMRAGYTMLTLVLFRVAWGFCGSRNARFGAFVRGPRAAARYARTLAKRTHEWHATHNPLGAWMVMALLAALLAACTLGLFTNDDVLYEGPLAVHLLSLELLLVWFPMGKLMHAVLFAFSRGATGARFSHRGVRV